MIEFIYTITKSKNYSPLILKIYLSFLLFFPTIAFSQTKDVNKISKKLIILSIDGFPGYYTHKSSGILEIMPNLKKLIEVSNFSNTVRTVYPSVTYPAHTSIVTGVDPIHHGIFFNIPLDPLNRNMPDSWLWFAEDQKVKSIWDFAKEAGLTTASIYWPVTVGANIDYNIPQYWRYRNKNDAKILKPLSTPGLYEELHKHTNKILTEDGSDIEKMEYAIALWKLKKPDLMLIYTTDIDTVHHQYGVYSKQAKTKLKTIDTLLGKLISETNLYNRDNLSLIVVSDHGFQQYDSFCYPNTILHRLNLLDKNHWSYYFLSAGGSAYLYKNNFFKKNLDMKELSKQISESCPGSVLDYKDSVYKRVKKKLSKDIIAVLYSNENTTYLKSFNGLTFKRLERGGFNHGFLPSNEDMFTIGLFYPRRKDIKIRKITDIFELSCEWLDILCTAGQEKEE